MKRSVASRLGSNQSGAVAPLIAIALFALIAVAGIAFDYARVAGMDTELQNAADQAALAAASQLDGFNAAESPGSLGACARARQAAMTLLSNDTRFANDGTLPPVTVTDPDDTTSSSTKDPQCNTDGDIKFYQDKAATTPALMDNDARFVDVTVGARRARYALTPIVNAITSGDIRASARAGLGTALCKIPPLMVCDPSGGGGATDWDAMKGRGIRAAAVTGKGGAWAPGLFGYLGPNDTPSTVKGLAYLNPVFSCQNVDTAEANTGNSQPAVKALNTRFDIFEGGGELDNCVGNVCPAAKNVVKDMVANPSSNNCGLGGSGWHAAANIFTPWYKAGAAPLDQLDTGQTGYPAGVDAMGLPRDNCHYSSWADGVVSGKAPGVPGGGYCSGGSFGDGYWARGDYFEKYHSGVNPSADDSSLDKSKMTRYETYKWEIDYNRIPHMKDADSSGTLKQLGQPVCRPNPPDISPRDRRVLTVAIATNCASLKGASNNVQIGDWVDMFFVEPGAPNNARGNQRDGGYEVYLEVMGRSTSGGSGQVMRRDVPYLVK